MLYSTIVDKNDDGLRMIIDAAEKFEEGKYLNAIYKCQLDREDIRGITEYVKERKARLSIEYQELDKFSKSFNKEYATNNNKCFDSAEKLFIKIRSTISGSKTIYKKFCMNLHYSRCCRQGGASAELLSTAVK